MNPENPVSLLVTAQKLLRESEQQQQLDTAAVLELLDTIVKGATKGEFAVIRKDGSWTREVFHTPSNEPNPGSWVRSHFFGEDEEVIAVTDIPLKVHSYW